MPNHDPFVTIEDARAFVAQIDNVEAADRLSHYDQMESFAMATMLLSMSTVDDEGGLDQETFDRGMGTLLQDGDKAGRALATAIGLIYSIARDLAAQLEVPVIPMLQTLAQEHLSGMVAIQMVLREESN